jgi:hypothetical protein
LKTFGTVSYEDGKWKLKAEPHVLLRAKRVFGKIDKNHHDVVSLVDTIDTARDLEWFLERYPMTFATPATEKRLKRGADKHRERASLVEQILSRKGEPRAFELAEPARDYQRAAAELILATGGTLIADDMGLGKAQPLDALVHTPNGWRRMGDLRLGDEVTDPDGGTAVVEGVFPQGDREVFRVFTADGASTECCDEHLWTVCTPNDRHRGTSRTLPLSEIRKRLTIDRGSGRINSEYFVPIAKPVTYNAETPLPLAPYLLGALLGDGCFKFRQVSFSCADEAILARVTALLPAPIELRRVEGSNCDYRVTGGQAGGYRNAVLDGVRALGLEFAHSWEKRIPLPYPTASVADRLELLRGLMDTDGTCGKDGLATFTSTSEELARDVSELVGSLGGFTTMTSRITNYTYAGEKRNGRRSYTLIIRLPICPFHLPRKVERWRQPIMARAIKAIEPAGRKQVQCIRVSSKRSLYITDGYIVTHNTITFIAALTDPRTRPALVVVPKALQRQWARQIKRFAPALTVHTLSKSTPYDIGKGKRVAAEQQQLPLAGTFPDVIISTYAKLSGWASTLGAGLIRGLFFDEAQELRTGDKSEKGQAAKHLAANTQIRAAATGTPIYNYGSEMFNVLECIRPGALGSMGEFNREWCDGYSEKVSDPKAFGTFLRNEGLMLRRTRADVGRELPALSRVFHDVDCDAAVIDDISEAAEKLAAMLLQEGPEAFAGERLQASGELSYLVRQATGLSKAPHVADFVRMIVESGEPVVLFGWHHAVYDVWKERLAPFNPVLVTGKESDKQKDDALQAFKRGESKVIIISLRCAAGLDGLQFSSCTVVHGELDWSPGVHEQCDTRVYRDGQEKPVIAYYLTCDDGSDPIISTVLREKGEQLEGIRDPDAEFFERLQVDNADRLRNLAESFLNRRARSKEVA